MSNFHDRLKQRRTVTAALSTFCCCYQYHAQSYSATPSSYLDVLRTGWQEITASTPALPRVFGYRNTILTHDAVRCCTVSLCRLEDDDDAGELGPTEVAVRMLFAPINPSDINQVTVQALNLLGHMSDDLDPDMNISPTMCPTQGTVPVTPGVGQLVAWRKRARRHDTKRLP